MLKADIQRYFETVDKNILVSLISKKISDIRVLWLIRTILSNYETNHGKGMPLGNLTSQFFANVYLDELDQFVKHTLKAQYYIRYVDDFVIFHHSRKVLKHYLNEIQRFLNRELALELHPAKSKIIPLKNGTEFLGMKIFLFHKIIKRQNLKRFYRKLNRIGIDFDENRVAYDKVYDFIRGWLAYAQNGNTYHLRNKVIALAEEKFKRKYQLRSKSCPPK